MKRFFGKDERYTPDGMKFCGQIDGVLAPIVEEWIKKGFSIRDMESIMHNSTTCICCGELLVPREKEEE